MAAKKASGSSGDGVKVKGAGGEQVNRGNAEGGGLRGAAAMMEGECVSLYFYIFIYFIFYFVFNLDPIFRQ